MKFSVLAGLVGAASAQEYWLKVIGGNPTINGQLMRQNASFPIQDVGVTSPPYNPDDHFVVASVEPGQQLVVVPTWPHPPPVPGYYALNGTVDGDAFAMIQTWRPEDDAAAGYEIKYDEFRVETTCEGRKLLRYRDWYAASHWVAVETEGLYGGKRWVPWWVKAGDEMVEALAGKSYVLIDLELAERDSSVLG